MAKFENVDDTGVNPSATPFKRIVQDAVDYLESITASDKAQAVPYILIWQIDPLTGEPVNKDSSGLPSAPLSLQLVSPPRFGLPVDSNDNRFLERPPVSLERIVIKTNQTRGIMTYRTVEMSIVVHRPDAIFGDPTPGIDNWSSLILPGSVHALEYGWSTSQSVKNPIINGEGVVDKDVKPQLVIPAKQLVRFTVTNYSFSVKSNGEISIDLKSFEDGEFNLRRAIPGLIKSLQNSDDFKARMKVGRKNFQVPTLHDVSLDPKSDEGKKVVKNLQDVIINKLKTEVKKGLITFQAIADNVFADVIDSAYRGLGYKNIKLYMGNFNHRVGKTSKRNGSDTLSNRPIGEFRLPFKTVEKKLGDMLRLGEQLTFHNFIKVFIEMIQEHLSWDASSVGKDKDGSKMQTMPFVVTRAIVNQNGVNFFIFDAKREFARLDKVEEKVKTQEDLIKILRDRAVPYVSFRRGNSYIKDASFGVEADDKIKSIFMNRYLRPSREDITNSSQVQLKDGTQVDARQLLYSSAIKGDIEMLGNFVFDMFGLVWLDFGAKEWSGPFYVNDREDTIGSGMFTTKLSVRSSGDDPLGTQGRIAAAKKEILESEQVKNKKPAARKQERQKKYSL